MSWGMRRLITIGRRQRPPGQRRQAERDSGEGAIETRQAREAEATPSHMNRLKTFRL